MFKFLDKIAGILHSPKQTLAKDVWEYKKTSPFPVLRSKIRDQILTTLRAFMPDSNLKQIVIIGSITGYKYEPNSDIDVNVQVLPYKEEYRNQRNVINERPAGDTMHPVNYFVQEYKHGAYSWQDSFFGVYDVLGDKWIVTPPAPETFREPTQEFPLEIQMAQHIANHFNNMVDEMKKDTAKFNEVKSKPEESFEYPYMKGWYMEKKQNEIQDNLGELIAFSKDVEKNRKMAYKVGFGVPRKNFYNLLYKFIEHGPNGSFFHDLQTIKTT